MRSLVYLGVALLCALPARGDNSGELRTLHTLTVIDSSLTKDDLDELLDDPLETVVLYATSNDLDPGARLRAIRALPAYCEADCELVRTTLRGIIDELRDDDGSLVAVTSGQPLLRLRAAVEALGVTQTDAPDDLDLLAGLLNQGSRDIRVTAVRALAAVQASLPSITLRCELRETIRARRDVEQVAQVVIAIDDAIRLFPRTCPGLR